VGLHRSKRCIRRATVSELDASLWRSREGSHRARSVETAPSPLKQPPATAALHCCNRRAMQPSAIGAGDGCCDRGRSRSSRARWRRAACQAAPGAHDGSPNDCDSRAERRGRDRRRSRNLGLPTTTAADRRPRARGVVRPRTDAMAEASRRPQPLPFTGGQAPARDRMSTALTPERSGATEGVRDGCRPAPVQIDDGGRRGPLTGL
jgi:hypothetical protein